MRPLIVCGYSGTGKTSFVKKAAEGLRDAGFTVAYIKHSGRKPEISGKSKDTELLFNTVTNTAVTVSGDLDVIYRRRKGNKPVLSAGGFSQKEMRLRLRNLLNGIDADYVLIEGFKDYNGPIPKIVFGRNRKDIENLKDSLTVAYSGIGVEDYGIEGIHFLPVSMGKNKLKDFIQSNTIDFAAGLDCGECGFPTCREFAHELLAGNKRISDCLPLQDDVKLYINGKRIYLKGFVRSTFRDIIEAYIKNLHGTEDGKIRITIG
ncbi:MAG: hypothetical protein GXP33_15540 [Spirochaetes bacterium]|nr:hypothetical protein [Spirochaetota bacterium]